MEVSATYEGGRLILQRPVRFRRSGVRVLLTIPDEEVEVEASEPQQTVSELFADLAAIRGEGYRHVATGKTDRELILEAIEQKYGAGQ